MEKIFAVSFWGVDNKKIVVGIKTDANQRDEICNLIDGKMRGIKPALAPSSYRVKFHQVKDSSDVPIEHLYVLEVVVAKGEPSQFYCSQDGKFHIKKEATCHEIREHELVEELRWRLRNGMMS